MRQYFGKYRGTVLQNVDPKRLGRVQVSVPSVLGKGVMSWALPCAPFTGSGAGSFMIPPIGANIWVEFEEGNPDMPIWVGGFWTDGQPPDPLAAPGKKIIRTTGITITLDETVGSGGVTIEVGTPVSSIPARFVMNGSGIELSFSKSKVSLTASSVSVNDGALEVI